MGPAVIGQGAKIAGPAKAGSRQRHERCPVAAAEATRVKEVRKPATVDTFLVRAANQAAV